MSSYLMDILHPTKNSIFLIWGLTSDALSPNPRGVAAVFHEMAGLLTDSLSYSLPSSDSHPVALN